MPGWLIVAVYTLAVARVTRLITDDRIFDTPRNAILNRLPTGHPIGYLIVCRWCASIWVAAPIAVVAWYWPAKPWTFIPALALAASHLTGLLVAVEGEA